MTDYPAVSPPPFGYGFYTIVGPSNLSLIRHPSGRPTLGYSGDVWVVEGKPSHFNGELNTWAIMHAETAERLTATNPYNGGPPQPQPVNGGDIYLTGSWNDEDYCLWVPRPTGDANGSFALINMASTRPGDRTEMALNVRGDDWEELGDLITWQWSGGKPNEVWVFKPHSPV